MRSRALLTEAKAGIQALVPVPQYVHRLLVPSGVSILLSLLQAMDQDLWECPMPCSGCPSQFFLWL